jgi:hypothetical protein
MAAREYDIIKAVETSVDKLGKAGIEFKEITEAEVRAKYPDDVKIIGRGAKNRVVHLDSIPSGDPGLLIYPVGGAMFRVNWEFYKNGAFAVGVYVGKNGTIFLKGDNYLDPTAVNDSTTAIHKGLVQYINSTIQ